MLHIRLILNYAISSIFSFAYRHLRNVAWHVDCVTPVYEVLGGGRKIRGEWGVKMQAIKAIKHVCDADLDMHRRNAGMQVGTMRRLLGAILGFQSGAYMMGTPRRSIDREQQEYTPYYD